MTAVASGREEVVWRQVRVVQVRVVRDETA